MSAPWDWPADATSTEPCLPRFAPADDANRQNLQSDSSPQVRPYEQPNSFDASYEHDWHQLEPSVFPPFSEQVEHSLNPQNPPMSGQNLSPFGSHHSSPEHSPPRGSVETAFGSNSIANTPSPSDNRYFFSMPANQMYSFVDTARPVRSGSAPSPSSSCSSKNLAPVKPLYDSVLSQMPQATGHSPLRVACEWASPTVDYDPVAELEKMDLGKPLYSGKKKGRKAKSDQNETQDIVEKRHYGRHYRQTKKVEHLLLEQRIKTAETYILAIDALAREHELRPISHLVHEYMDKIRNLKAYGAQWTEYRVGDSEP